MLGAAISAAVASGMYSSFDEAISMMASLGEVFYPDSNVRDLYMGQHAEWQQVRSIAVDLSLIQRHECNP